MSEEQSTTGNGFKAPRSGLKHREIRRAHEFKSVASIFSSVRACYAGFLPAEESNVIPASYGGKGGMAYLRNQS